MSVIDKTQRYLKRLEALRNATSEEEKAAINRNFQIKEQTWDVLERDQNKISPGGYDLINRMSGAISGTQQFFGDMWNDSTGVTTAREVEEAQQGALDEAKVIREEAYEESSGFMDPYSQAGGQFLGGLAQGVASGQFTPGTFAHQGQPVDNFNYGDQQSGSMNYGDQQDGVMNYQGQKPGVMNYQGQQAGASSYQGGPEMRSISEFMGDPSQDPGYQFRLDQGLKAIDRQAAAGGRFGGGQTAKELMRFAQGNAAQGYGDDFNRAAQEREAMRFGETDMYGRGLGALNLRNQAEQSAYGRGVDKFGRTTAAEQSAYGRSEDAFGRSNLAERDAYGRAVDEFGRGNLSEQSNYDRARMQYGMDVGAEQLGYDRNRLGYDYAAQNMQDDYNKRLGMMTMGRDAAQSQANAALGHGTNLANIATSSGDVRAASIASQGTNLGHLMGFADQASQAAEDGARMSQGGA